jgi:hypothetical protein
MGYDFVCFSDGTKAPKSSVGFCVAQIKLLIGEAALLPVVLHLIELSERNQRTSFATFSRLHIKQLLELGILERGTAGHTVNPVFRNVLLEANRQNNMYDIIFDKVLYDKYPEKPKEEEGGPFDKPEGMSIFFLNGPPLFEKLQLQLEFYDSQTQTYSNIEYKPDHEFAIPDGVRSFIQSLPAA